MDWKKFNPPPEAARLLSECANLVGVNSMAEVLDLACGGVGQDYFEVSYDVAGQGPIVEATVARVRNGLAVNYPEPYMRRRDPDCMVIADQLPTDKPTFKERFGYEFDRLRLETLAWLKTQPLVIFVVVLNFEIYSTFVPGNQLFP